MPVGLRSLFLKQICKLIAQKKKSAEKEKAHIRSSSAKLGIRTKSYSETKIQIKERKRKRNSVEDERTSKNQKIAFQ